MADDQSSLLLAPPEVLMLYLVTLDAKSLQAACRSSREFSNICRDDYFWYQKVLHDYGEISKRNTWKKTWINIRKYEFTYEYELYNYDRNEANNNEDYEWVGYPPSYNRIITKDEVEYLRDFLGDMFVESNDNLILDEIIIDTNQNMITFIILENPLDHYVKARHIVNQLDRYFKELTEYKNGVSLLPLNDGDEFDGIYPTKLSHYTLLNSLNKSNHVN